jgi:serine/threonine protein kinase
MRFTYSTGDRPLEGYTIKRGVGCGGFGEVYYAVSDGGKEVALKLIQRHLDVELRGVAQCLNLKHANLIVLYDVKQSEQGDHWVVMEYVVGTGLADVIAASPQGMSPEQAVTLLRGISAGVGHLHDNGIVHRDLKPGNIFIENGQVKIGDYGLAKFISASRRSGQSESVGTVHYMAPEVSRGRYGKEIDLYAMGVILYELLTGRVPFDGQSPGEILMRHLTEEPDLTVLPQPYRAVVARLLAKDPQDRYPTVQAMLVDLEARLEGREPSEAEMESAASLVPAKSADAVALAPGVIVSTPGLSPAQPFHPSSEQTPRGVGASLRAHPILWSVCVFLTSLPVTLAAMLSISEATAWPGDTWAGLSLSPVISLFISVLFSAWAYLWRTVWPVESGKRILAAAARGDIACVQHLLDQGADPNVRAWKGETALMAAATGGHTTLVHELLNRGADVDARNKVGQTALIRAAANGHPAIVKVLLQRGAEMDARDSGDGSTALLWAAYEGHKGCVEVLLERGADINAKDTAGNTPLIWAAYNENAGIVQVLLAAGADPFETDSMGWTARDYASADNVVKLLDQALHARRKSNRHL